MNWRRPGRRVAMIATALTAAIAVPAVALDVIDFGEEREDKLESRSNALFGGIGKPLPATAATVPGANGPRSIALASGLEVSDVLRGERKGAADKRLARTPT